jgi:C4-dicarboxylate-specific signal transduction histidine kinase
MSAIRTEMTLIERAQGEELLASLARVRRYTEPGQTLEEQFQDATRPPEPCALYPLLDAMGGNQSWRSHGVVHVDLDCPPDLYVMANKWLLSQAFANMLDNARLAIQDIAVDFGTIRVLVTGDDSRCAIDISDSGCGLTDEIRTELETWRPVPSTRGRGVGLLHSRRWFERYGGNLEIKPWNSDLGGAWFRVELPRCDAPPS